MGVFDLQPPPCNSTPFTFIIIARFVHAEGGGLLSFLHTVLLTHIFYIGQNVSMSVVMKACNICFYSSFHSVVRVQT